MFAEGLVHDFGQIFKIFPFFFHAKDSSEKIFGDVLDRKQAFLGSKNISFFPVANWMFPKGLVHQFWSKMLKFFISCFCAKKG